MNSFHKVLLGFVFMLLLLACGQNENTEDKREGKVDNLTVYKALSCSCCSLWVDHIQARGFSADVVSQKSVAYIKDHYQVPENARSCHTAVSEAGFVFEGHVPARYIKQFLENPTQGAKGLVVPAMPLGSPGMEYKEQFNPYTIYWMDEKGELFSYAFIENYAQQFE